MTSSAFAEAARHRDSAINQLQRNGSEWILAQGYLAVWKRIHRAEEALIEIESRPDVVGDALYDEWRLQDSTIDHRDGLLKQLRQARTFLQSIAVPAASLATPRPTADREPSSNGVGSEADARAVIRAVRHALNDFRDDRWEGLVRARNLLMGTMILTELFAFALLALAILEKAPAAAVAAAIVFFLVGAVVGLFNRLSQQAAAGTTVDDYSLAEVRLLVTPVFSGLAAIAGVVLTGTVTLSGLTGLVEPAASARAAVTLPILADIFDLDKFRIGLLLAALFGWAPTLVAGRLQQFTDRYKRDIESTEPSSGLATPGSLR